MAGSSSPPLSDSLESCDSPEEDPSRTKSSGAEGGKQRKKFHPFRAVRNIFRRAKRQGSEDDPQLHSSTSKKSRSTSELSTSTSGHGSSPTGDSRLGYDANGVLQLPSNSNGANNHGLHAGLSVSHDSIFASEHSASISSGSGLKDGDNGRPDQQGSVLSVHHMAGLKGFREELRSRFRNRRDSDDEDDPGLPRSPCTSPTTADILAQGLKDKSSKSHSTCSAGSLISMCSSENDEDLSAMFSSSHSSSRRSRDFDGEPDASQPVPLNHEAAHHKMSVRPKRTHGLPRHRRMQQIALAGLGQSLPATPEVLEDANQLQPIVFAGPEEEVPTVEDVSSPEILDSPLETTLSSIYCSDAAVTATTSTTIVTTGSTSTTTTSITNTTTILTNMDVTDDLVSTSEVKEEIKPASIVESKNEIVSDDASEPVFEQTAPSVKDVIVKDTAVKDDQLPLVKGNKSKSKSAELKLKHEIKQFSKRQQEKLKSGSDSGPESVQCNDELCDTLPTEETVPVSSNLELLNVESRYNSDLANGNVVEPKRGSVSEDIPHHVDKVPRNIKEVDVPTHDFVNIDKKEHPVQVQNETGVTLNNKNEQSTDIQESKQVHEVTVVTNVDAKAICHGKPKVLDDTVPSAPVVSLESLEGVVLRHPEKWVHDKDEQAVSSSNKDQGEQLGEIETINKTAPGSQDKAAEHAFSSGDFAGIMKKRRSATDSCVTVDLPPASQNRPASEMLSKPGTPSKRLSVEIATFDQRAKEQNTKQDSLKNSGQSTPEPPQLDTSKIETADPTLQCPPVTIRIRRGKSLIEKYPESGSETVQSDIKQVEKPFVRPRSQFLNQADSNNKVPEFMKIQLRSSREELDVVSKADTAPTNQQPQWEVKIHPQLNQRRQSSGPNSLPYVANKSVSEAKVDVTKTPPREVKNENTMPEKDSVPEIKVEMKDDNLKVKRNSSENKENVGSANVPREIIERKISVEEANKEVIVERHLVPDIRRRSFVQPQDNDEQEPELLRVFARRSYKQKSADKNKKEEPSKEENKGDEQQTPQVNSEVKETKEETTKVPVKVKTDTKAGSNENPVTKAEEVQKQVTKEQLKSFAKHSAPVNIMISELPTTKPNSGPSSPKVQSPKATPSKPERQESLRFRVKPPDSANKPAPQSPKVPRESSPIKPQNERTSSFVSSKVERRDSSSFKVKPSEPVASQVQSKDSDKSQSPEPKVSLRTPIKKAEVAKTPNVELSGASKEKDSGGKDAPTWLQLAQQRREKREQKERLLYGQNSNSFLLEGASKPSRNSKVLDLVNNFQKLQTT